MENGKFDDQTIREKNRKNDFLLIDFFKNPNLYLYIL